MKPTTSAVLVVVTMLGFGFVGFQCWNWMRQLKEEKA